MVDKMVPVALVTPICRVVEHDLALLCGPTDVIEVEVGEDDVGDVAGLHPRGGQTIEQPATGEPLSGDRPDARVYQHHLVAYATDEEPAERHLHHPVVVHVTGFDLVP